MYIYRPKNIDTPRFIWYKLLMRVFVLRGRTLGTSKAETIKHVLCEDARVDIK